MCGRELLFSEAKPAARRDDTFVSFRAQAREIVAKLLLIVRVKLAAGQQQFAVSGENADDVVARPIVAAAISKLGLVARVRAPDADVLNARARQQLQPLLGRGNLHSLL